MPLPRPEPGLVVSYSYLWRGERLTGGESGRKARPSVIVIAMTDEDGETVVYVAPITHSAPIDSRDGIALPAKLKRRLGMDDLPSWVITTELNRFVWPGFDLAPARRDRPDIFAWGFLPTDLFAMIKNSIVRNRAAKRISIIDRG